ncbi:FG-GAP repeat domain-containing protein [Paracidobacterium acidisoli]|uniref:VCBS repeat-containing protein n=1 Tax=Paracidobacterium acidisoli TaxID=2303751 RepID=A0A372IJI5_9BACT|nr:VCBS repeat-containing protein [Paracidobacterium acidisoli]MBT9333140.1 VCBS repeat-containing protein [Paracidobacterium acidisoli]
MARAVCLLRRWIAAYAVVPIAVAILLPTFMPSSCRADDDDGPSAHAGLTAMADFNRDGATDIVRATIRNGSAWLTVLLGQSGGAYQAASTIAEPGSSPKVIVTGDFNGDGNPDVVVGNDDGSVLLFTGDGTGRLALAGEIAHVDSVVSMTTADFNHDHIPDLAISDWHASRVTVLLGSGNGTFRQGWSSSLRMPGTTPHISAADFNGDGIPDLAVVYGDDDGYTFDVMIGDGKGNFLLSPQLSVIKDPNAHCAT